MYIAPSDSPYFSPQSFADIQEISLEGKDLIVLGDLNSRMGDLDVFVEQAEDLITVGTVTQGQIVMAEICTLCVKLEI